MAPRRTYPFVLVKDFRWRAQQLLQAVRAIKRARSIESIRIAHRLRNLNFAFARHLLADQGHREERRKVIGAERLPCLRIQRRVLRPREVRRDVVPALRQFRLVEDELRLLWICHGKNPPGEGARLMPAGPSVTEVRILPERAHAPPPCRTRGATLGRRRGAAASRWHMSVVLEGDSSDERAGKDHGAR